MEHQAHHRAPFDSRAGFHAQVRALIERSRLTLQLFDPDFTVVPLGDADVDAGLRRFLAGGGRIALAVHRPGHIERACPRFVRLLRDYNHLIECRATPPALRQLTDSFVIGDGVHIVRRFHCDHLRGEAGIDDAAAVEVSAMRFAALWLESRPVLAPTVTGL